MCVMIIIIAFSAGFSQQTLIPLPPKNPKTARPQQSQFQQLASHLKSVNQLEIDYDHALAIKRGDLSTIQGEVFRAYVKQETTGTPIILKRLDCIDRRIFDHKIYECDTFMRFRGHPNIVPLYAFWPEQSPNKFIFKSIVLIMKQGLLGDMLRTVVLNPIRLQNKLALKYISDIAKGLAAIHACGLIHAGIKPSNIYIDEHNVAMLGEIAKVELDSARNETTQQLFSKILIGQAMPQLLVYWAPQLFYQANKKDQTYSHGIDLWALGVTIYQIVTGEHPFDMSDENTFRKDVLSSNVDYSRLFGFPKIKMIIQNLLKIDPIERWSASQVLKFVQQEFAIEIQRHWRGFLQRREFERKCRALIIIQSNVKGFVTRLNYRRFRVVNRERAAIKIQSAFRSYLRRKVFRKQKKALMKCQANVLTRQIRRAYIKTRNDIYSCQAYVKRFLSVRWYRQLVEKKKLLQANVEGIQEKIQKFNSDANQFKGLFQGRALAGAYKHMDNFQDYALGKKKRKEQQVVGQFKGISSQYEEEKVGGPKREQLPKLHKLNQENQRLKEYNKQLERKINQLQKKKQLNDYEKLKSVLGDRYDEMTSVVDHMKQDLRKVAQTLKNAKQLPILLQHVHNQDKWDAIHDPKNSSNNILKDDDSIYKKITPVIDITLHPNLKRCLVSQIMIHAGEIGPTEIDVLIGNKLSDWKLVKQFIFNKQQQARMVLPGEQIGKHIQLRFKKNIRGGKIIAIRYVVVKGVILTD